MEVYSMKCFDDGMWYGKNDKGEIIFVDTRFGKFKVGFGDTFENARVNSEVVEEGEWDYLSYEDMKKVLEGRGIFVARSFNDMVVWKFGADGEMYIYYFEGKERDGERAMFNILSMKEKGKSFEEIREWFKKEYGGELYRVCKGGE